MHRERVKNEKWKNISLLNPRFIWIFFSLSHLFYWEDFNTFSPSNNSIQANRKFLDIYLS